MARHRQRQLKRGQPAVRLQQRVRPDGSQPPPNTQPPAGGSPAASSGYQIASGGLMNVYAVTGASGRLGRLVVEQLTAHGVPPSDIVALVRTPGTRRPRRRGARRLSLLSIPSTAVVTVMLAGMGAC